MPQTKHARTPGPGWQSKRQARKATRSQTHEGGVVAAEVRTAAAVAELGPAEPLPPPPLLRAELARMAPMLVVTAESPQPERVVAHRPLSIDELRAKIASVAEPVELVAEAVLEAVADEEELAEARAAAEESEENSRNEP